MCIPEPLNTVRNLRVYDPSTSSLNVRWDHADGNPRQYKLFYAPTGGGPEELVIISHSEKCVGLTCSWMSGAKGVNICFSIHEVYINLMELNSVTWSLSA